MVMHRRAAVFLAITLISGCSSIVQQPANPKVVQDIVSVCTASGYFKFANGIVSLAFPGASLPISIVNAGIDKVCMDPTKFAADASTVQWLVKNLLTQTG
jgi:hypothetical protein